MPHEGLCPSSRRVRLWLKGHYRLTWPADVLRRQGYDVRIIPPDSRTGFMAKTEDLPSGEKVLRSLRVPEDADVVVFQRPARPLQVQMIQMMRANGIAVVIDMDDDMSSLHPGNATYMLYHPGSNSEFSWKVAEQACKEATLVTTSTKALQRRYAKHGRGVVIDNYVPEAYLQFTHYPTGYFGWCGTTKSHPNDLQVTGSAVQQLMDQGYKFKVVGGKSKVQECLRLKGTPETVGPVELSAWVRTMCQNLDVSICPLAPTEFNTAKSRLKPLEAMAVGLAWVASPREEYRRIHRESGVGFLADSPKQWIKHIKALMDSDSLREEQAQGGREYMKGQTYQLHAWRWMEAWEQAYKIERNGA